MFAPGSAEMFWFQSTLPVRGATPVPASAGRYIQVSIHAPRAGSDCTFTAFRVTGFAVSIHAPRAGSDRSRRAKSCGAAPFQSTLPVRGATYKPMYGGALQVFQSTLPVRGATMRFPPTSGVNLSFNPRSPCGERLRRAAGIPRGGCFNPRSPCGERLEPFCFESTAHAVSIHAPRAGSDTKNRFAGRIVHVSIHAPRAGSDHLCHMGNSGNYCFNPRSPCGERHHLVIHHAFLLWFQSTLPVRGATTTSPASL